MAKETDPSDDFFKGDCQIRLAPKIDHSVNPAEVTAELILLLSYDHPLVHNVIKRAKEVEEVEVVLHLLWGFRFPIYVNPSLDVSNVKKLTVTSVFEKSRDGDLLFPIRYINNCALYKASKDPKWGTSYYDASALDELLDEEMGKFLLPRIVAYKEAADWETWKTLSLEHRKEVAGDFLRNLYETFSSLQQGAKAAPEVDARTAQQKIIYQMPPKSFPSDHMTTRMELPNNFDLILPSEMQQIQKVVKNFNVNGSPSFLMARDYLAQYLPLLLQRRQEAIQFPSKPKTALVPNVRTSLPAKKWWWPFARSTELYAPVGLPTLSRLGKLMEDLTRKVMEDATNPDFDSAYFPTYFNRNYFLDQLVQSLQDSTGPHQARLHNHALQITTTNKIVPPPEEITRIEATEIQAHYDIATIVRSLRTDKDLPAGKIEEQILKIPDPNTLGLQSVPLIRAYGTEIFYYLNLLTQNLSALKNKNYNILVEHLQKFSADLNEQGANSSTQKFTTLALLLTSFETYQHTTHVHAEQVEAETQSYIAKIDQYLVTIREHTMATQDPTLSAALLKKTEELQVVYLLAKSQILATVAIRKQNEELLYENLRQLQLTLATMVTQSVLSPLTDADILALQKSLQVLLTALTGPGKAP